MIKGVWERVQPKHRRILAVAGIAGLLVGTIWIFAGEPEPRERRGTQRDDIVRNVLTDRDTRDVTIDGLSAQVRIANQQSDDLRKELDSLRRELAREDRNSQYGQELQEEIAFLREQVDMIAAQNLELMPLRNGRAYVDEEDDSGWDEILAEEERERAAESDTVERQELTSETSPEEIFRRAPLPQVQPQAPVAPRSAQGAREGDGDDAASVNSLTISSHFQQEAEEEGEDPGRAAREESIYLPAGSILTGVLLNGMDAPTNQGSRRDPFPSTVRIQHEAILPNRFRADVKECFLIISGYGDLSSERAYLRGETISCVREDGGVIEARMDSYAVGEDGKAGIRGRLVSKQGAMIARSMMAGFMSGAASAFDVSAVPVIQTSNIGGRTQYQSNFSPSMFQGAAAQGASQALDRIAEFYVQMAEGIFPVIEVDAGRQVELIMTRGTSLQIRSQGRGRD